MPSMFEITGEDIALLNDEDLRSLIGLLCEAELRRQGHSVSHVTWGGDQSAKDGGVDVRVSLPDGEAIAGFVPKPKTGFQAKISDMPRAAILDEMRPNGVVRPVVAELAKNSGAYIIVSSSGSTSDLALENRHQAMADAVQGMPHASKLTLEFYDRNRLASWVRDHPGLIPWVRSRIGKSVPGWQSYGSWSRAPGRTDNTYLFDDKSRIRTGDNDEGGGLSAVEGINRIRDHLQDPGSVVRLVGLSGVGKTRLCEALFDETIGEGALDPSLAIYTNLAAEPDPPPIGLASDLVASRTRAILVVDNCPPDLHRQLTEIARQGNSTISVITVEYDIREDQPEGTDVFELDSSSLTVIETLVQQRYPKISQIDAATIAEFSGGNARVALALAATVRKNESIAGLGDAELFKRLFQQRHEHDPGLLSIAQVCSLLYSFDGVSMDGNEAELPILALLIGKTAEELYPAIAELKRRDLLQERGVWRAVLPHAIANRLATLALQNIPISSIADALIVNASVRLRRSFSRRLGYLDGSGEARELVKRWLAPGGMLSDIPKLNDDERAMLENIAPVSPGATLASIETALSDADELTLRQSGYVMRLLRSLAYDPALFERAVSLLLKLANAENSDDPSESDAGSIFASLFQIVLSGTHAPVSIRLKVVEQLLLSVDRGTRTLGTRALEAMLRSSHFSSSYGFDFGARSRDHGYHPRTGKDVKDWFDAVLQLAVPLALSDNPVASNVRRSIAGEFEDLWMNSGQADTLESLARQVAQDGFWRDGWLAIRRTIRFGGTRMPADVLNRLRALEELLRPKGLVDEVLGLVLGKSGASIDLYDVEDIENGDFSGAGDRLNARIEALGKDVSQDEQVFEALLPDLVKGGNAVGVFGRGLGSAAKNPREMWSELVDAFASMDDGDTRVIGGFLSGLHERDPSLADGFLDEALEHSALAPWFPQIQTTVAVDDSAVRRLQRSLELDLAPIRRFDALAYGRVADNIPGAIFRDLVVAIGTKPGGMSVALEVLSMRLFSAQSQKQALEPEIIEAGRDLLQRYEFPKRDSRDDREDRELGRIIRISLEGDTGEAIASHLVRKMMEAINRYDIYSWEQSDLLTALLSVHPILVLDEIFSGNEDSQYRATSVFLNTLRFTRNPLDVVPNAILLSWCDQAPDLRYPIIAAAATLFSRPKESEPHHWKPLTLALLAKAPDRAKVFAEIVGHLHPMSWSGSLATKLDSRLKLLETLPLEEFPELHEAWNTAMRQLQERIDAERKREAEESAYRDERFE